MGVTRATRAGRPPASSSPLAVDDAMRSALVAFASHGYDGCSVQRLARELGVSHNLLNQRFGTKDDLWRAAVDWGFDRMRRALRPEGNGADGADGHAGPAGDEPDGRGDTLDDRRDDTVEQLRVGVVRYVRAAASVPELPRLMTVEGAIDGPRLRYAYERHMLPVLGPLRHLLARLEAEGRVRPIPFRTLCFLILGGGVAPFTQPATAALLDPTDPFDPAAVEAQARIVADLLVAVLRPPAAPARRPATAHDPSTTRTDPRKG